MSDVKGYIDGAEFIAHVKRRISEEIEADREAIARLEMELVKPTSNYRVDSGVRIPIPISMQQRADDWERHEMLERWKKNLAAKEGRDAK